MLRLSFALALLLCVALPAPALAQGLYEPFPEPTLTTAAQGYVQRMGVTASAKELADGRFVGGRGSLLAGAPASNAASTPASARAGVGSSQSLALVALLGCMLIAGAGLLILQTRR